MESMAFDTSTPNSANSTGQSGVFYPDFLMKVPSSPSPSRNLQLSASYKRSTGLAAASTPVSSLERRRSGLGRASLLRYERAPISENSSQKNFDPNVNTPTPGPPSQSLFDSFHNAITSSRYLPAESNEFEAQNSSNNVQKTPTYRSHRSMSDSSNYAWQTSASRLSTSGGLFFPINSFEGPRTSNFWVTVYGFPHSAVSVILSLFSQCGTIVDKELPKKNGNYINIKYLSRVERDRALNYNSKLVENNIIGVIDCIDSHPLEKQYYHENLEFGNVRSLAQNLNITELNPTAVAPHRIAPVRATGILTTVLNIIFGWIILLLLTLKRKLF